MIRTYDNPHALSPFNYDHHTGIARAFVSDKFKTFDNSDLLESALPTLGNLVLHGRLLTMPTAIKNFTLD